MIDIIGFWFSLSVFVGVLSIPLLVVLVSILKKYWELIGLDKESIWNKECGRPYVFFNKYKVEDNTFILVSLISVLSLFWFVMLSLVEDQSMLDMLIQASHATSGVGLFIAAGSMFYYVAVKLGRLVVKINKALG